MMTRTQLRQYRASLAAWAAVAVGVVLAAELAGCTEAEDRVPPAKVETVTAYGMTLDQNATPQQVTYVLLRSLADDVHAAQAHPPRSDEQKAANMITWSVAAPNVIEQRLLESLRTLSKNPASITSLGKDRNKEIYRVVNLWAPIVAYYVDSFDKDPQAAMNRMRVLPSGNGQIIHVLYDVWPDASRPDAGRHETLDVELVREKASEGSGDYWRVARIAYLPPQGSHVMTQPAVTPMLRPTTRPALRPMLRPTTHPAAVPTTQPG
jgi:hypothetical protein